MNIERLHHLARFEFEIPQNKIALLGNRLLGICDHATEHRKNKGSGG